MPTLKWKKMKSYEQAKSKTSCVYAFRRGKKLLYIGKAKQFGGPGGRYAYGYGYLVDSLLAAGCALHIAEVRGRMVERLDDIERTLIKKYQRFQERKQRLLEPKSVVRKAMLPWQPK